MHKHSAACRGIEPSEIEHRLRLACSEEIPLAVHPSLDPRVVAVCMGPPRSIYLTGRDSNRPEGRHQKRRFLSATSVCCLDGSKRRAGTTVRRHIDGLLVAPVIDFKDSIIHRHGLYPWSQLSEKYRTGFIQILVVDSDRKNKMTQLPLRNALSPWHLLERFHSKVVMLEIILR